MKSSGIGVADRYGRANTRCELPRRVSRKRYCGRTAFLDAPEIGFGHLKIQLQSGEGYQLNHRVSRGHPLAYVDGTRADHAIEGGGDSVSGQNSPATPCDRSGALCFRLIFQNLRLQITHRCFGDRPLGLQFLGLRQAPPCVGQCLACLTGRGLVTLQLKPRKFIIEAQ